VLTGEGLGHRLGGCGRSGMRPCRISADDDLAVPPLQTRPRGCSACSSLPGVVCGVQELGVDPVGHVPRRVPVRFGLGDVVGSALDDLGGPVGPSLHGADALVKESAGEDEPGQALRKGALAAQVAMGDPGPACPAFGRPTPGPVQWWRAGRHASRARLRRPAPRVLSTTGDAGLDKRKLRQPSATVALPPQAGTPRANEPRADGIP
jgi:hypothetical protein